jgi:uncharacterized protein
MIAESRLLVEHHPALSSLSALSATRLTAQDEPEVLRFLQQRALHNAVMTGRIMDNGIESNFNRGSFFGCRDAADNLVGVALIGHGVFLDARSEDALREFARLAQDFPRAHMLMGEQEMIERFWTFYAPNGQAKRRRGREVLLEITHPAPADTVANLRLATAADLSLIVPVHATMACEESGVNPLEVDPDGFRERCRRRVAAGRTWILVEQNQLVFKVDVISDTSEVIYLEGIYVHPEQRRKGHASRCLTQLIHSLLTRSGSVSVLVNQERQPALDFFNKLGFVPRGLYDTIFLRTETQLS